MSAGWSCPSIPKHLGLGAEMDNDGCMGNGTRSNQTQPSQGLEHGGVGASKVERGVPATRTENLGRGNGVEEHWKTNKDEEDEEPRAADPLPPETRAHAPKVGMSGERMS